MAVAQQGLTLQQFLELPEEKPALEYIDGAVEQKVSPKGHHSMLQYEILDQLNKAGRQQSVALALPELRTTFAGVSRVPDIAVYRWDRIPRDAKGRLANDFGEPPDVAIEIASPEQSVAALVRRCLWFVANGVGVALLVDPADESILAFRPGEPTVAWRGEDRIDLSDVLPELDLTVDQLFASLLLP